MVKSVTIRSTPPFLSVIAGIGGLRIFLQLFCGFFGTFFSWKFFNGLVAKELYIEKNLTKSGHVARYTEKHKFSQVDPVNGSPADPENQTNDEITDKFMRIKMSSY